MTDTIIVIGKTSVRASEREALATVGRALYARSKQLICTKAATGAAAVVASAYIEAGGTPIYFTNANYDELIEKHPVICFTDTKYVEQLNERMPGWEARDWTVIHNPKATEEAAAFLTQLMHDLGTPVDA